jgi:pimeloyl-ACP methyl ester carboxylesterase
VPFMPFQIAGFCLRSVVSLVFLGVGIYLIARWNSDISMPRQTVMEARSRVAEDKNKSTMDDGDGAAKPLPSEDARFIQRTSDGRSLAILIAGIALILWSVGGGWISSMPFVRSDPESVSEVLPGTVYRLTRPDGTELHIETSGPADGMPVILTHGWTLDSNEWRETRKALEGRFRVIVWDLPGLGRSKGPSNNDWSLEKLAIDLDAVLKFAGARPAILVGHSIGGMIILTYCKLFPDSLTQRVAGLVLGQTTYTNPTETTQFATFYRMIQKPVLEPLCYLMIGLSPLVRAMNFWSYVTGSIHSTNHKSFFSGNESREQLNFISRYGLTSSPGVIARGFLAMFKYDATTTLHRIAVPTVIVDGDRDSTCLPDASIVMASTIPNARRVTLQSARHGGVFEFHKRFAEAIHEFDSTSLSKETIARSTLNKPTAPIDHR